MLPALPVAKASEMKAEKHEHGGQRGPHAPTSCGREALLHTVTQDPAPQSPTPSSWHLGERPPGAAGVGGGRRKSGLSLPLPRSDVLRSHSIGQS